MTRVIVKTSSTKEFFGRAKEAARLADEGRPLRGTLTLSFESPERMFSVLSAGRRKLMGHGVQTIVSPIAKKIDLVATLAGWLLKNRRRRAD